MWFMTLAALSQSHISRLLLRDASQCTAHTLPIMNNEMKHETHRFKEGARLKLCKLLSNLFTSSLVIIVELFLVVDTKNKLVLAVYKLDKYSVLLNANKAYLDK